MRAGSCWLIPILLQLRSIYPYSTFSRPTGRREHWKDPCSTNLEAFTASKLSSFVMSGPHFCSMLQSHAKFCSAFGARSVWKRCCRLTTPISEKSTLGYPTHNIQNTYIRLQDITTSTSDPLNRQELALGSTVCDTNVMALFLQKDLLGPQYHTLGAEGRNMHPVIGLTSCKQPPTLGICITNIRDSPTRQSLTTKILSLATRLKTI